MRGDNEIVRRLLKDSRVNPRARNSRAIAYIFSFDKSGVVKTLLEWRGPNGEKIDPSVRNNQAIIDASRSGNDEVIKLLLKDPRVDPRTANNISIFLASRHGYYKTVKTLLSWRGLNGEKVDPSSGYDRAIQIASRYGHDEVVKLLANIPKIKYRSPATIRYLVLNNIYNAYRS